MADGVRENLKLPQTIHLQLAKGPDVMLQDWGRGEVEEEQEEGTSKMASGARRGRCPREMSSRDSGTFSIPKGGQWSATSTLELVEAEICNWK